MSARDFKVELTRDEPRSTRRSKRTPEVERSVAGPEVPADRGVAPLSRVLGNDAYGQSVRRAQGHRGAASARSGGPGHPATATPLTPARVQRMAIGPVDDPLEREADSLAAKLHGHDPTLAVPSPDPPPSAPEDGQNDPSAWAPHRSEAPAGWASPTSLESGGRPLPARTREFYEERLGYDLSSVRVHVGPKAARKSDEIDAHAFTYRSHVWLGDAGRLRPSHVLAHELVHVVQQTRPDTVGRGTTSGGGALPSDDVRAGSVVRRVPFWVPRGMSGTDIHSLVLGQISQGGIDNEVGVPNADARDWGLGLQGRADLYRASHRVGIYFENRQGLAEGNKHGDLRYARPAALSHRGRTPRPYLRDGAIQGITSAPSQIEIGDLKPASRDALQGGQEQLDNYERGFEDTRRLTNEWAAAQGRTERWRTLDVSALPDGAVTIPSTFQAGSRGQNRELIIADVELRPRRGIRVRPRLDPRRDLGGSERIGGDLYVEHMGRGLWAYYAVPLDSDRDRVLGALSRGGAAARREAEQVGYIRFADQVAANLATLRQELEKVRRFPKRRRPESAASGRRSGASVDRSPVPARTAETVGRDDLRGVVRRRRRTTALRDPFDRAAYRRWKDERNDLRRVLRGRARSGQGRRGPSEADLERLRLLGLVYEAEEALASRAQRQNLPSQQQMRVEIEPHRHGAPDPVRRPARGRRPRSSTRRPLPELYLWMERWTSRPADVLGLLRYRFGRVFVAVSRRLERFRRRMRERMRRSFGRRSSRLSRRGWVAIAVRALGRGLREVGKLLLQQTTHLLFQAIQSGVERKLETMFDFDENELVQETFDEIEELADQLQAVRGEIDRRVSELEARYSEEMEYIEDLVDLAEDMGPIIEVGMIIAQCATPPGWGCLKLIAQEAIRYAVDEIVATCYVQRWVAGRMLAIDGFNEIPPTLAQTLLDLLRDLAPDPVKDVFDGPIPSEPPPSPEEVPCDEESEGVIEGAQALSAFHERNGSETTRAVGALGDARGMPDEAPLDPERLQSLQEALDEAGATPADLQAVADGTADDATTRRLKPLTDEIDDLARGAIRDQLQAALQEGRFDRRFRHMEGSNRRILVLGRLPGGGRPGAFGANRRVLYTDGTIRAAGVAHVIVGQCRPDGTVDLQLSNLTLFDASGQPIEPSLRGGDLRTDSARCVGSEPPPPPPSVAGDGQPPRGTPPPDERAEQPPSEMSPPESEAEPPPREHAEGPAPQEPPSVEPPSAEPPEERGRPGGRGRGRGGETAAPTVGPEGSGASWLVSYEAIRHRGYQVYPAAPRFRSGTSTSIVLPDNQRAILTPTFEGGRMTLRIGGLQGRVVGHASRTDAARGFGDNDWWELTSGPLYDTLMRGLAAWIRAHPRIVDDPSAFPRRLFFIYSGTPDVLESTM